MEDKDSYCIVTLESHEFADRYEFLVGDEVTNRRARLTCILGSDVPLAQAASTMTDCGIQSASLIIVSAPKRRISHWPPGWNAKYLRVHAVNCPDEAIHADLLKLTLTVNKVPRFDTPLRLNHFHIVCEHLPAIHHFAKVTFYDCYIVFASCDELPVWCTRRYGKWHRARGDRVEPEFDLLYHLLIQSLPLSGPCQRWLTKGLYDPRLLITIASFL
jgi:hypothetical protein